MPIASLRTMRKRYEALGSPEDDAGFRGSAGLDQCKIDPSQAAACNDLPSDARHNGNPSGRHSRAVAAK